MLVCIAASQCCGVGQHAYWAACVWRLSHAVSFTSPHFACCMSLLCDLCCCIAVWYFAARGTAQDQRGRGTSSASGGGQEGAKPLHPHVAWASSVPHISCLVRACHSTYHMCGDRGGSFRLQLDVFLCLACGKVLAPAKPRRARQPRLPARTTQTRAAQARATHTRAAQARAMETRAAQARAMDPMQQAASVHRIVSHMSHVFSHPTHAASRSIRFHSLISCFAVLPRRRAERWDTCPDGAWPGQLAAGLPLPPSSSRG